MCTIVQDILHDEEELFGVLLFPSFTELDLTKIYILRFSKASAEHSCDRIFRRSNRETNISITKERNCFVLKTITRSKKEKPQWPWVVSTSAFMLFYLYLFA